MPFLILCLFLLLSTPALACDCPDGQPNLDEAFIQSSHVFLGKAARIEAQGENELVTFEVRKRWKGPEKDMVTLQTTLEVFSCDYSFVEGTEYLVFAAPPEADKTETPKINLFRNSPAQVTAVAVLPKADYCGLTTPADSDEAEGYLRALQSVGSGGFVTPTTPKNPSGPSRSWERKPVSGAQDDDSPYIKAPTFGPGE